MYSGFCTVSSIQSVLHQRFHCIVSLIAGGVFDYPYPSNCVVGGGQRYPVRYFYCISYFLS